MLTLFVARTAAVNASAPFNLLTDLPAALQLLLPALLCLAAGTLLPLIFLNRPRLAQTIGMAAAVAGGIIGCGAALAALLAPAAADFALPWATAGVNFALHLDPLAAFFLLPLFLLVGGAALYGSGYLGQHAGGRATAFHWFFFNLLGLSMALVVCAANGLIFLLAWEGMSISSFFLVVHAHQDPDALRAGNLYLIATHVGAALLFAFFLEAGRICGTLDFAGFAALATLSPPLTVFFFLLLLVGFGAKAGLFPLHVWLPDAHPAAPSHVSALMSGVMVKTAIYGLLRMLSFLPPLPAWCGLLVIGLGISGALFGITCAMLQDDLKRSLAYSTVENIGLIFFAIGLWLYGGATGHPTAAVLALAGGLLHVWNHALFKGLLFFGAGAVQHATSTRTISHLGGLLRRMPLAGSLIILASGAIAALPPLNGFISEWLLLMALLGLSQAASGGGAIFFLLLTALLALVGGLVLLTFSRLAGLVLLGEPRRRPALGHEPAATMAAAMVLLALLCVGVGLLPMVPLKLLTGVTALLAGGKGAPLPALPFGLLWSITGGLLLLGAGAVIAGKSRRPDHRQQPVATWGCGFTKPTPRMVYMAGGFSELAAETMLCAAMQPATSGVPVTGIFPAGSQIGQTALDPVLERGLGPLFSHLAQRAYLFRKLQAGRLNVYLLYMFVATTLLLGWVMVG